MAGHRYWRITLDATTPPRGLYSISELQFREVAGVAQVPSGGTMTAADTYPGLDPNSLVDGNSGTYWASNAGGHQPQWLTYDYGAGNAKTIVEMAMIAEPGFTGGGDSPTSLTPGYSDDGIVWTYLKQVNLPPLADNSTVVFAVSTALATNLVPSHPYYETRNDIPNAAGMQFSLVAATTFNRIGGMCGGGTLSPQTIILKNVTDNVELARVTIDMTGKTADQYYYAAISPVTLVPGKTYNLWALTTAGGGYYYADDLFTYCFVYNGNTWSSIYGSGNGTVGQAYSQLWGVDLDYVASGVAVALAGDLPITPAFGGVLSVANFGPWTALPAPTAGFTIWNAADKASTAKVLNGGLIVGSTSGTSGARGVAGKAAGKYYFEATFGNSGGSSYVGIGTATAAISGTTITNSVVASGIGVGTIWLNNASGLASSIGTSVNGSVIGIAVDLDNHLIWFRLGASGNWNGVVGASPGGTGGVSFASIGGGGFSFYPLGLPNSNQTFIIGNFGGGTFAGAVPAGFTAGWTTGSAVTSAVVTQAGLETWVTTNPPAQVTQAGLEVWYANQGASIPAQVTQVALEEWASANPPAQVTQVVLEMWASVALYTPPPYVPPPPPPPTHGKGHGKPGKGGPPKLQFGAPGLQGEISRFEAFRPHRKHRAHGIFPPPLAAVLILAETAASASTIAATVRYAASLTASAVTSDVITSGRMLLALLAAGAAVSEALGSTLAAKAALSESGHGLDALGGALTAKVGLTESGHGIDALGGARTTMAALAESSQGLEALSSGRMLFALLAAGATANDALSAKLAAKAGLAESSHGLEALGATAKILAQLAGSAITSDMPYHGDSFPSMLSEGAVTGAAISAFMATHAALADGVASSAAVTGFRTLLSALAESGAGSDALHGLLVHNAALAEGSAGLDQLSAIAAFIGRLDEAAAAGDVTTARKILAVAIAEGASTFDADRWIATNRGMRGVGDLIGRRSSPDLTGERSSAELRGERSSPDLKGDTRQ